MIDEVVKAVNQLGDPYTPKPGVSGLNAYPPKHMAITCILKNGNDKSFRLMAAYLLQYPDDARRIGFTGDTPSKSTIAKAHKLIPDEYFKAVNRIIVKDVDPGDIAAGDTSGYSESSYDRWIDQKTGKIKSRHSWEKLHDIVAVKTRVILDYMVTGKDVSDVRGLEKMLKDPWLAEHLKDMAVCLDSAYLSRSICDTLDAIGATPIIHPKKNTTYDGKGSAAWEIMMALYLTDPEAFFAIYNQRNIVEAVFGALKKMYGGHINCRHPQSKRNEIASRVICYNIEVVARAKVKDGRLTRQMLEAIA